MIYFENDGDVSIGGDININSNNDKTIYEYSNDELFRLQAYTKQNLSIEFKKKVKRLTPYYILCGGLFLAGATWGLINGKPDITSFFLTLMGFVVSYTSIQATCTPNKFEDSQQLMLIDIEIELKRRRAVD